VKEHHPEFQSLGCEVIGVSFASPQMVALFLAESPMPFPVLSDTPKTAYQALGLGRTSWRSILRAGVVWRYLKLIFGGWLPRRSSKDADVLQLGGDFVLDAQRRLVLVHRSAEPTDRPSIDCLLQAVRSAL
jgi:hypothetical protein